MNLPSSRFLALPVIIVLTLSLVVQGAPRDPAKRRRIPDFVVPAVQADVAYERFMVFGDMGTGRPDQHRVAAAMAQRAKSDGLDFMITVGDNFYESGVESVDDPQWQTKFENVYDDPALQVIVYPSLGNHDHRGNIFAQVEYSKRNPNWRMAAPYYTFTRTLADGTAAQFFAIDSDPVKERENIAAAQIGWLDEELSKSTAQWKVVYGHHPLYSNVNGGRDRERRIMIAAMESIFTKNKVDVYFAGHDHTLEMLKPVAGVNYVISGGGAGPERAYGIDWTDNSLYAATLGGFTLCRLSADEMVIEFVRLDGATEFAHVISKEPLRAEAKVPAARGG